MKEEESPVLLVLFLVLRKQMDWQVEEEVLLLSLLVLFLVLEKSSDQQLEEEEKDLSLFFQPTVVSTLIAASIPPSLSLPHNPNH